jgi:FxsC-like protein
MLAVRRPVGLGATKNRTLEMADEPYYFFVSYARDDGASGAIETFYSDLVEAVRDRRGGPANRVGFLDTTGLQPGAEWPDQLPEELSTCRSFVPILSPTYFDREFCGKEWAVFAGRLKAFNAGRAERARLIQPVQLVAPQYLTGAPAVVSNIQRTHGSYPDEYNAGGLRKLIKLGSDAYGAFVEAFADTLVAAVEGNVLPASPAPDIDAIASAFQLAGTHLVDAGPGAAPTGPRYVHFFFVAAKRSELKGVRQDLQFYGEEGGLDWRPYLPELATEIAIFAQQIATQENLRYESVPVRDDFADALDKAVQRNTIVVVVVDSWTVRLTFYRDLMRKLDDRELDNCIVVVPWNPNDPETTETRDLLVTAIQVAFAKKASRRDPQSFVDGAMSHEQLKTELAKSLVATQARILATREVIRKAEATGVFVNPQFALPPAL